MILTDGLGFVNHKLSGLLDISKSSSHCGQSKEPEGKIVKKTTMFSCRALANEILWPMKAFCQAQPQLKLQLGSVGLYSLFFPPSTHPQKY